MVLKDLGIWGKIYIDKFKDRYVIRFDEFYWSALEKRWFLEPTTTFKTKFGAKIYFFFNKNKLLNVKNLENA